MKVASVPISFMRRSQELKTSLSILDLLEDRDWALSEVKENGSLDMDMVTTLRQKQLIGIWITNHLMDPDTKTAHNKFDHKQFHIHVMLIQDEYYCLPLFADINGKSGIRLIPVSS